MGHESKDIVCMGRKRQTTKDNLREELIQRLQGNQVCG